LAQASFRQVLDCLFAAMALISESVGFGGSPEARRLQAEAAAHAPFTSALVGEWVRHKENGLTATVTSYDGYLQKYVVRVDVSEQQEMWPVDLVEDIWKALPFYDRCTRNVQTDKKANDGGIDNTGPSLALRRAVACAEIEIDEDRDDDPFHLRAKRPQVAAAAVRHLAPMQPWELDKLESAAAQVVSALASGRYCHDFGEMLLQHLQGWSGAEEWAQAEQARVRALVANDGVQSRTELRLWLEDSLIGTLREVQKEINRGQLAGSLDGAAASSASGSGQPFSLDDEDVELQDALAASLAEASSAAAAAASSSSVGPPGPCGVRSDAKEDEEFLQALLASQAEAESNASPRSFVAEVEADASPRSLCCSEDDASPKVCQAAKVATSATLEQAGMESAGESMHKGACPCGKVCDLGGMCCSCACRHPGAKTLAVLEAVTRRRHPDSADLPAGPWAERQFRFLCSTCAKSHQERSTVVCPPMPAWTLPFGGVLLAEAPSAPMAAQVVELTAAALQSIATASDVGEVAAGDRASSSSGSWVRLAAVEVEVPDSDSQSQFDPQAWVLVEP